MWFIHPASRALLPWALARGISANAVSVGGLIVGAAAAACYFEWRAWLFAFVGLLLSAAWLIADGLDGMVARATGTASALGRVLDGVCDHGVFILLYVALVLSLGGGIGPWALALSAGAFHAVQSSLYEGERARFHRRIHGQQPVPPAWSKSRTVRGYDWLATSLDRVSARFDALLDGGALAPRVSDEYGARASGPMRLLALLSANTRAWAIFIACIAGDPRLFWWFEIVALSLVALAGMTWHRRVEAALVRQFSSSSVVVAAGG